MQPRKKKNQFQPKWRHFHPQSTVWVQNILSHDVIFNVADEHNQQFTYKLPTGQVSELPGGAVATLGVKAIVDELIQNNKNDVLRIWDADVRQKYENDIILRIKEAPLKEERTVSGEINLGLDAGPSEDEEEPAPEVTAEPKPGTGQTYEPEEEFPDAKERAASAAKKAASAATSKLPDSKEVKED